MPSQSFKVGEMLNKRTENSKTWMNFDGSFTTEIHNGPVHYLDENGHFQNVNTDLYDEADFDQIDFPVAKDGDSLFYEAKERAIKDKKRNRLDRDRFDFQGLKVPFDCKIPRNIRRGYSIGKGTSKLSYIPVGASSSRGHVEGNRIIYPDVWPDADVVLELTATGIKESIILKTEKAPILYSFKVEGELHGELKIESPWLEDSNKVRRDVIQGVREDENGTVILELAADVSGLTYPVVIDPTTSLASNANWHDTHTAGGSSGTNFGTLTEMDLSLQEINTPFIRPDISSIPAGSVINSATINLYCFYSSNGDSTTSHNVTAETVTGTWSESTITRLNQPGVRTPVVTTINGESNKWKSFNVTSAIQEQVNGTGYGFRLRYYSPNNNFKFYTSEATDMKPYLTVNYNPLPTAPVVLAPNGGEKWNSQHTISWTASSDPQATVNTTKNTILEDFEDAIYQWPMIGSGWARSSAKANGGTWSLKSTSPGNSATATIQFNIDVPANAKNPKVSFYTLVSSEANYDFLKVDLTGYPPEVVKRSGIETTWIATSLNLIPGQINTLTFSYMKDGSGAAGDDAAYVDNITVTYDTETYSSASSHLKYNIQLSPDNGATWKDIVPLTAAGATSVNYDFINEPDTSTAKLRIRAYDGSAYGPWDESNGIFTIEHNLAPTTPTNLSPTGVLDRNIIQRLSWKHNDSNSNDPQSKFELQWRLQGASTWNTVTVATPNQYWDAPASRFPRGTIEWQVRTYDQAGLISPFSNLSTFIAGDKPTAPVPISPINNSTVSISKPNVQWSSSEQVGYHLKLLDTAGVQLWEDNRLSTNKAVTLGYNLNNNSGYKLLLAIRNADGLYSDFITINITVSYTPPAIPAIVTVKGNGYIQVNINDPIPTGTQPNVSFHEVYKEIEGEFILVATNVQNEFKDYLVASREEYRYFVRSIGVNNTFSDTPIFVESITFIGVWLHLMESDNNGLSQFKFDGGGRSSKWGLENAIHQFQGRKSPVIETGEMTSLTVDFNLKLVDDAERKALENIVYSQQTVCYRDGRGRKLFGVFVDVPMDDEIWRGYSTKLSLLKIDYKEGIA